MKNWQLKALLCNGADNVLDPLVLLKRPDSSNYFSCVDCEVLEAVINEVARMKSSDTSFCSQSTVVSLKDNSHFYQ